MQHAPKADQFRVILFKEGDTWVAQGLEHDICVQAPTMGELYGRFDVAVRLEENEPGGLDRIGQAPKHFFDLWEKKAGNFRPTQTCKTEFDFGVAA